MLCVLYGNLRAVSENEFYPFIPLGWAVRCQAETWPLELIMATPDNACDFLQVSQEPLSTRPCREYAPTLFMTETKSGCTTQNRLGRNLDTRTAIIKVVINKKPINHMATDAWHKHKKKKN